MYACLIKIWHLENSNYSFLMFLNMLNIIKKTAKPSNDQIHNYLPNSFFVRSSLPRDLKSFMMEFLNSFLYQKKNFR